MSLPSTGKSFTNTILMLLFQVSQLLDGFRVGDILSHKGCHAIVETAHLLLAAGCPTGKASVYPPYKNIQFHDLLALAFTSTSGLEDTSEIISYTKLLKRIAEFFELLVSQGIMTKQVEQYSYVMHEVANLTRKRQTIIDATGSVKSYNVIMDIWIDIYRCFLLSDGPTIFNTDGLKSSCINASDYALYVKRFINRYCEIAGRSPQCSRAMGLIRLILGVLSANGVNRLKNMLKTRQRSTSITAEDRACVDNTLEWMGEVKSPRCLKHIARTCVHRAMKHRSLQDAAILGLPAPLLKYVLLLDE